MADEPTLAELQAQAEDRGLPKYGTKAELSERIAGHDEDLGLGGEDDAAETEPEEPETEESDDDAEPAPEPVRAGGYVNRHDDAGWVPDPDVEPPAVEEPVEAGEGGLPGHPTATPAGWSLPKDG